MSTASTGRTKRIDERHGAPTGGDVLLETPRSITALLAALLLMVSSCGGIDGTPTSITSAPTEPMVTAATLPAATTTSTVDIPPEQRASPERTPEPLPGSEGALGSGCVAGPGPLPDGMWFGSAVEGTPSEIHFDLACMFVGDAANRAETDDGMAEIPVPNDYYIRDEVDTLRTVPVSDVAVVHAFQTDLEQGFQTVTVEEWLALQERWMPCPGSSCLVWLYVNDGAVTEIVEQYTP